MVLVSLIWVFTTFGCLRTLEITDYSDNEEYSVVETWGIKQADIVQGRNKIRQKFGTQSSVSCENLHKSDDTPFVAIVLYLESGRLLCMGSIIDNLHILSAKRCYTKVDSSDLKVLAGCIKAYWGKHSQIRRVRRIIRHEYEIAILRMVSPLHFNSFIKPINLPDIYTAMITTFIDVYPGPYKIAGFHVERFDVPGDFVGKRKSYEFAENTLVEFGPCAENFSKLEIVENLSFCTAGEADFCWGALGGPVTVYVKKKIVQVGVIVADNCTSADTGPYLCARTDTFGEWIKGNAHHGHQPL